MTGEGKIKAEPPRGPQVFVCTPFSVEARVLYAAGLPPAARLLSLGRRDSARLTRDSIGGP